MGTGGKPGRWIAVAATLLSVAATIFLMGPAGAGAIGACPGYTEPPVAEFSFSPTSPYANQTVNFDGSASEPAVQVFEAASPEIGGGCEVVGDSSIPITAYEWDFGDGTTTTTSGPQTTHSFAAGGTYTVTLEVHGNTGPTSSPKTHGVPVTPPPTCSLLSGSTNENTPVEVALSCTSPSGVSPTYSIVAGPSHGSLSGLNAATGKVTYTPASGYSGGDTFTYRAQNPAGFSNTAMVSLTVKAGSSEGGFETGGGGTGGGGGTAESTSGSPGGTGSTGGAAQLLTGAGAGCSSNSFTFGRPKLNVRKGTAALPVTVTCPGSLRLTGKGIKGLSASAQAAGTVKLQVVPVGAAKRKLAESGKLKVSVSVTFMLAGGAPSTAARRLTLLRR